MKVDMRDNGQPDDEGDEKSVERLDSAVTGFTMRLNGFLYHSLDGINWELVTESVVPTNEKVQPGPLK